MKTLIVCMVATVAACGLSTALAQDPSRDLVKPSERTLNIRAVVFSPDGKHIASCSGELKNAGEVVVWNAKSHEVRWHYKVEKGMTAVAFSPDGKTLAVGSFSEHCYLFDAATGKLQSKLPGHGDAARRVAFSPDGQILAVGSYDKTIRLWDWKAGKVLRTLEGQGDKVYSLTYLPSGKTLASGGSDSSACIWDTASGKLLHNWPTGAMPIAFDPQGQWLATAGNDATVSLRSIPDNEKTLAHYDRIYAYHFLVIHPSSKVFAAHSGMDRVVRVFPIDLAQPTKADEKRVEELMALWDKDAFEVREKASTDLAKLGHAAKPQLTRAVKDSSSAEVRIRARELLRQLGEPKPLAQLHAHEEGVSCACFSPDGQVLATGGRDGRVVLWDTTTYQKSATLQWPKS